MNFFLNKKVGVLGLSRTGKSLINFLTKNGFTVFIWDDKKETLLKEKKKRPNTKILNISNLKQMSFILTSPGVPSSGEKKHFILKKTEKRKIEILNDIELFFRFNPESNYIGVTGTNGKSTTVTLLNHILKKLNIKNTLSGNIGKPIFNLRKPDKNNILEISSFQLEKMKLTKLHIGVLLNISKDHIDRHENLKKYSFIKSKIFNNQSREDYSIIGIDDEATCCLAKKLKKKLSSKIITISGKNNKADIFVKNKKLIINFNYENKKIFKIIDIKKFKNLIGEHNYQNIAAVYAILLSMKIFNWKKIEESIKSFEGLPHRLQNVRLIEKITFINDSKATNVNATSHALKSFNNIYWILGGRAKEKKLQELRKHFFRIKHVFLIGETKFIYEKYLKNYLNCSVVKNLKEATKLSYNFARKEKRNSSVVLFSPACSSLDEWKDFEERGNAFVKFVKDIKK